MGGLSNLKHSPPEKRGLGFTFMGMQAREREAREGNNEVAILRQEISELRAIVDELMAKSTPKESLWKRFVDWIRI